MLFTINIYGEEGTFERLSESVQASVMEGHYRLQDALSARGKFATMKLMSPSSAVTLSPPTEFDQAPLIVDGPFAETKEQFLGFYAADFRDLDEAIEFAKYLSSPYARIEVRAVAWAGGVFADESRSSEMA